MPCRGRHGCTLIGRSAQRGMSGRCAGWRGWKKRCGARQQLLPHTDAMNPRHVARISAVLLTAGLMTGCGQHGDRAAVAAAKCYLPVVKALHLRHNAAMDTSQVQVTGLGHGRYRVTGVAEAQGKAPTDYTCEVAPDSSDKLRGFRVTRLILG